MNLVDRMEKEETNIILGKQYFQLMFFDGDIIHNKGRINQKSKFAFDGKNTLVKYSSFKYSKVQLQPTIKILKVMEDYDQN